MVEKGYAIVAVARDVLIAVLEVAMFERAVEIAKLSLACLCPHFAVVIAKHNRPRLAELFHDGGKHLACLQVVEAALIEPRHRIDHIPRHDHEIGIGRAHDFLNRSERELILFSCAERAADVDIGQLQDPERLAVFFHRDFSSVARFKMRH